MKSFDPNIQSQQNSKKKKNNRTAKFKIIHESFSHEKKVFNVSKLNQMFKFSQIFLNLRKKEPTHDFQLKAEASLFKCVVAR